MFKRTFVAALTLSALGCSVAPTQNTAHVPGNVHVVYLEADKFTDIGERYSGSAESQRAYLAELEKHIAARAASLMKDQQRLVVTISDIDMAGAFEPWRRHLWQVRIIRDVYPPRIDLTFTLTDAGGAVVKSGERKLRDLSFMMSALPYRSDPLRYEKKLLGDWLERELRPG